MGEEISRQVSDVQARTVALLKCLNLAISLLVSFTVLLNYFLSEPSLSTDIIPDEKTENKTEKRKVNPVIKSAQGNQVVYHYNKRANAGHYPGLFQVQEKIFHFRICS